MELTGFWGPDAEAPPNRDRAMTGVCETGVELPAPAATPLPRSFDAADPYMFEQGILSKNLYG